MIILALVVFAGISTFWVFWVFVVRVYRLRRFYERQGIKFVKDCYAIIGAELRVMELVENNKSHDWLYIDSERPTRTNLVGTIRGFSIQLYGTSAEVCRKLIHQNGTFVDRDTPALYSFGRLSPNAIAFTAVSQESFTVRKASLTRALNLSMNRLFHITQQKAEDTMARFSIQNGSGTIINVCDLLRHWTAATSGEFIWGKRNVERTVEVYDENNVLVCLQFMTALHQTFTGLRFYGSKFWNRVYAPVGTLPVTRENRRLAYNVRVLREAIHSIMATPEEGSIAQIVQKKNEEIEVPLEMTRDDLIAATIAGLDTVISATMATLWNILQPENVEWRDKVTSEVTTAFANPETMHLAFSRGQFLNAVIYESMRLEPPGSLMNNTATADFDFSIGKRSYKIKSGTRIVTSIHALHQNDASWESTLSGKTAPLDLFDPTRFVEHSNVLVGSNCFMPFGKGPRRCPGRGVGLLMIKVFIANFLRHNSNCYVTVPKGQTEEMTHFNLFSRATYDIHCVAD
jgi:hypothetical protein